MDIRWYGHAAFRLTPDVGPTIITDPFEPELVGYAPIPDPADIVVRSSPDDAGHCREDLVPGMHKVAEALDIAKTGGTADVGGVTLSAMLAMEDANHFEHDVPGQNAMYRFDLDGISVAHMGDVGNRLTPEQLNFFQDVDVLLALTGSILTIRIPDLMDMIHETKPKVVIPMHFRTLTYRRQAGAWIEEFLENFADDQIDYALSYDATITKTGLPDDTRVLVMDYHR